MWLVGWIFLGIICFCLYVLIGLYISGDITQTSTYILTWVIYSCLCFTFLNVFVLAYFWETLRNKSGPYGIRGPSGEIGTKGIEGTCDITSTQSYLIMQLNTYLDELYKSKTGKNILDQNEQKFPNTYLTNKIKTQAGSRQYTVLSANNSNLNKPVNDLVNYVKSIWKTWFDLIYEANPDWFLDEYGDEDYSWNGENPFIEIRKYDIYYWGITRIFRPLKAEICRTTPEYQSSKLPLIDNTPRLKILESNDYDYIGDDYKTRGDPDASWWRAKVQDIGIDKYYPVGDIITAGDRGTVYRNLHKSKVQIGDMTFETPNKGATVQGRGNGPEIKTILVSGDLKDPLGYTRKVWIGGNQDLGIGTPECPEGYESLGDVLYEGANTNINNIKCIPSECVENNNRDDTYYTHWTQNAQISVQNDWTRETKAATGDNGYNLFRTNSWTPLKRIKSKCLESNRVYQTKDIEFENERLGIGWYGHPYKLDPKYSIFSFLDIVPEGMIVHKSSGRRFYIIHYGGDEANLYNILDYSDDTNKFDNALQVDSIASNSRVNSRKLSRKNVQQQWQIILQNNKQFLKLLNKYNQKYLYVGLEPLSGSAQFSTIDLDFDNYKSDPIFSNISTDNINSNTTFTFISSFGTHLNIINEDHSTSNVNISSTSSNINNSDITRTYKYVIGNRIRITASPGKSLKLAGVFIYDDTGKLINTDNLVPNNNNYVTSSKVLGATLATNALKIVNENRNRNINNAINLEYISSKPDKFWNDYNKNPKYFVITDNSQTVIINNLSTTINSYWQIKFNNPMKIAAIELWGHIDSNLEHFRNITVEIFDDTRFPQSSDLNLPPENNDTNIISNPIWIGSNANNIPDNAHYTFIIESNGIIKYPNPS